MRIQTVHEIILDLARKNSVSYLDHAQIDRAVDRAQMDLFREKLKTNEDLHAFRIHDETLALTSGEASITKPSSLSPDTAYNVYRLEAVRTTAGEPVEEIINTKELGDRLSSHLVEPTVTSPICIQKGNGPLGGGVNDNYPEIDLIVYPTTITSVKIDYLRRPQVPVFGVSIVGGRNETFDEATSNDLEWPDTAINQIIFRAARYLSIPLKDEFLAAVNNQMKEDAKLYDLKEAIRANS